MCLSLSVNIYRPYIWIRLSSFKAVSISLDFLIIIYLYSKCHRRQLCSTISLIETLSSIYKLCTTVYLMYVLVLEVYRNLYPLYLCSIAKQNLVRLFSMTLRYLCWLAKTHQRAYFEIFMKLCKFDAGKLETIRMNFRECIL